MNGRVYDPFLGRMISADPTVPGAGNGQAFNRYSYVLNNPLSMTDPSGFNPENLCGGGPRCHPAADGGGGIDYVTGPFGEIAPGCTDKAGGGCANIPVTDMPDYPGGHSPIDLANQTYQPSTHHDPSDPVFFLISESDGTYTPAIFTPATQGHEASLLQGQVGSVAPTGTTFILATTDAFGGVSNHGFVIAVNPSSGTAYATRAGPAWGLGDASLYAQSGAFTPAFADTPGQVNTLQTVGTLNISLSASYNLMGSFARMVNSANITYGIIDHNSNSYAYSFLRFMNLPPPTPMVNLPGWSTCVPTGPC